MKYKKDDLVLIRSDLALNNWYGSCKLEDDMILFSGKIMTVEINGYPSCEIIKFKEDDLKYHWSAEMILRKIDLEEEYKRYFKSIGGTEKNNEWQYCGDIPYEQCENCIFEKECNHQPRADADAILINWIEQNPKENDMKEFTKDDLKVFDIVEWETGKKSMVVNFTDDIEFSHFTNFGDSYDTMEHYHVIKKVWRPTSRGVFGCILHDNDCVKDEDLIYPRPEEPKETILTYDEIADRFGIDVDTLKIKKGER